MQENTLVKSKDVLVGAAQFPHHHRGAGGLGVPLRFFKPETVDFMIREHEGKTNGTGTLTAVSPGTHHCEPAWPRSTKASPCSCTPYALCSTASTRLIDLLGCRLEAGARRPQL